MFKEPAARAPSAARAVSLQPTPGGGSGHIYRDDVRAAGWQLERLLERRDHPGWQARLEMARSLYAERAGRVAAGAVAMLAGVTALGGPLACWALDLEETSGRFALALALGWPMAMLGYVAAWALARRRAGHLVAVARRLTGDVHADLARVESGPPPAELLRARAVALEAPSVGFPLAGFAFLAPLSLHGVVWIGYTAATWSPWSSDPGTGFGEWMRLSAMIVGHAHVVLAVFCAHFAWKVRRTTDLSTLRLSGWISYGITVAAAAVPGIVFLALPPLIVAATGLVFIPFMFTWARCCVERERVRLAGSIDPRKLRT